MTKKEIMTRIRNIVNETNWPYVFVMKIDPSLTAETKGNLDELVNEGVLSRHRGIKGDVFKIL